MARKRMPRLGRSLTFVAAVAVLLFYRTLAGDRLANSSDPISVIALSLGYESESAFSTAFKRDMGCSPRPLPKFAKLTLREGPVGAKRPFMRRQHLVTDKEEVVSLSVRNQARGGCASPLGGKPRRQRFGGENDMCRTARPESFSDRRKSPLYAPPMSVLGGEPEVTRTSSKRRD
jgi:AraC-like DNA-binding protein